MKKITLRHPNPIDGAPWTLSPETVCALLDHCLDAPQFVGNAADRFVASADYSLRYYVRVAAADWRPVVTLEKIAKQAGALAETLNVLFFGSVRQAPPRRDPFGDLMRAALAERARRSARPVDDIEINDAFPRADTLRALAAAAKSLSATLKRGVGKRDTHSTLQRHLLIGQIWSDYPESLRSLKPGGHFIKSLRLILGKPDTYKVRRALKMDAERALKTVERIRNGWANAPLV